VRRGPTAYACERRYLLRCLAATLENDVEHNGAAYIFGDDCGADERPDEPTLRRRVKAARALVRQLRRAGREP